MTLRQWLFANFGWDIYDWADDEIQVLSPAGRNQRGPPP